MTQVVNQKRFQKIVIEKMREEEYVWRAKYVMSSSSSFWEDFIFLGPELCSKLKSISQEFESAELERMEFHI